MIARFTFWICLSGSILVQGQSLAVSEISDSLKTSAYAVTRYDSTFFRVKNIAETELHHKYAITILKPQMKNLAEIELVYDQFSTVTISNASVYDASGSLLKKLKAKEITDNSGTSQGTMISDDRVLYGDLRQNNYPYTIVVEYRKQYKGSMFYPSWYAFTEPNMSVEGAYLTCTFPVNLPIRYLEKNIKPDTSSQFGLHRTIVWSVSNIPALNDEYYSAGIQSISPQVLLAPSKFKMNDYEGDMTTWTSYGDWVSKLIEGRDVLTESEIQNVRALTADLSTTEAKIQKLYEYMQANSRYVAIQLGIGGWQPFEASFVSEKKYGDCKALSNYTKALLSAIDIPSNYTLVRATRVSDMQLDFPNARFNHAILCVPNKGDTIWLECTSQTNPVGYMGTHTGNRHALVINEDGGHVVRTPYYSAEASLETKTGTVVIQEEGISQLSVSIKLNGIQIENEGFDYKVYANSEVKEKWISTYLDLNSIKLDTYEMNLTKHPLKNPVGQISANFTAREVGKISGSRLIINPNLYSQFPSLKFQKEPRKTAIELRYGRSEADTILWKIPTRYNSELIPKDISIESKFGTYKRTIRPSEEGYHYIRFLSITDGVYPKEEFEDFAKFIKAIIKADGESMVFINKT